MATPTEQRRVDLEAAADWLAGKRGEAPTTELTRLASVLREMASWCKPMSENEVVVDYWQAHYTPHHLCGLCGNSGILDARAVLSNSGVQAGEVFLCMCPNGQRMRELGVDPLAAVVSGARHTKVRSAYPSHMGGVSAYLRDIGH